LQKELVKWIIELEILPAIPCGICDDCVKSIEVMADGLRKFNGEEGALMADYFDNLISDSDSFSKADLIELYQVAKAVTIEFNNRMFSEVLGGFTAEIKP